MFLCATEPLPRRGTPVSALGLFPPQDPRLTSRSLQVSLNAWFWSTVFHTKDTDLTEVSAPPLPLLFGTAPEEPQGVGAGS